MEDILTLPYMQVTLYKPGLICVTTGNIVSKFTCRREPALRIGSKGSSLPQFSLVLTLESRLRRNHPIAHS